MSSYDDDGGDRHTSKGGDRDHGGSSPYRSKHKSRESNHDRSRTKEWNRDRNPRDYNDRNVRDNRGRHKSNYGRHMNCDYESKRTSGFDMAPPVPALLPGGAVPGQLLGVPQTMPGMLQSMLPFGTPQVVNQLGALSLMPAQAMTQQATRHARRVYVGGLPPMANEQTIATFFSSVMAAIGGNSAGTGNYSSLTEGDAVVNVYINHEKKFAFVEMRTVEEASNAMALDGIVFEGVSVRVRRPTDYNPSLAATLGPSQPSPHLNLAAVRLTPGLIGGVEGPDRVFVGGLPYYFTEAQIRELLESFGPLRGFDLVKDRDTGNSKGYGFCIYKDPAATDIACAALNGLKMGDKTLTVRRATMSNEPVNTEHESILAQAQQHIAMQKMTLQAGGVNLPGVGLGQISIAETPTKVLCLTEVISADELMDDGEYEEILEDMREEGGKFGVLMNVIIPRPATSGEQIAGVGKVFLEYADITGCAAAKDALGGRKFGGNTVTAVYYAEDKYYNKDYSA
ncbi:U2 snRNP auxilliary factor, large subunit, splicing factor [Actinidia rufa]|uniref:Splicing factor U2af large subunit n=1 Tax=Actinidia rufa TaxID=165716 RepID=A0A7J0G629_9ERIC|nr:U2 snRNP auxilliary factor, large subunit, splicing factor [Actinidia rufa]